MPISITPSDVRDAGDLDSSEYPDAEIQFETDQAQLIVNEELAPHSTADERLRTTAALLGAAYVKDERRASQVQQGGRQMAFNSEDSLSLWRQATQMDPTGRLKTLEDPTVSFEVY